MGLLMRLVPGATSILQRGQGRRGRRGSYVWEGSYPKTEPGT